MKNQQVFQDNRTQIHGKEAKNLDELLQEFKVIKSLVDDKTKRLDELKNAIKAYGIGYFETSNFTFDIIEKEGQTRLDKKKLELLYPEIAKDEKIYTKFANQIVLNKVERKA